MKNCFSLQALLTFVLITLVATCSAQLKTGVPPYQSFSGGPDVINLGNLNVHYSMPIFSRAGRGTPFTYALAYDTSVWTPSTVWSPNANWGLHRDTAALVGYVSYSSTYRTCSTLDGYTGDVYNWTFYAYVDSTGTSHPIYLHTNVNDCANIDNSSGTVVAGDGSGITVHTNWATATVTLKSGAVIKPQMLAGGNPSGNGSSVDNNGNQITATTVSGTTTFTDTLGSTGGTALTITGAAPSPVYYKYTAPSGTLASVTATFKSYTIQTNFGCSNVGEYGPLPNSLVDKITLPDGTNYQFSYETTPGDTHSPHYVTGRLSAITLPTGGTISYAYTGGNNGIMCSDGSASGFDRTTPDGTWHYVRSGSSPTYTTTVTTPVDANTGQANVTVLNFQGNYETERQVYQGLATGTPLQTVYTCYNGNNVATPTSCPTTAVTTPFSQITKFTKLNASGLNQINNLYDGYGNVVETDEYDYGVTTPTRKTLVTYDTTLGNGIVDRPASVIVEDGANNLSSKTTYIYDETAPTATTGTPQHVGVTCSAGTTKCRGNATTINGFTTSSTSLGRTVSYYDTGNVNVMTNVNGSQTTYIYGSGSCGNSFPTTVNEPLGLTRSMTWNCTGGMATNANDENSRVVKADYTDGAFWRPADTYDQSNNETTFGYDGQTTVESYLYFNGNNSTSIIRTTTDSLGRPNYSQRWQGPTGSGNYDTAETDYDALGRPYRSTTLYSGVASPPSPNTSAAALTRTYDALGRVLTVTDASGGTVSYQYTKNDVFETAAGVEIFRKQYEYDGLGRLSSVCEVSSTLAGVATCGQSTNRTGYWTRYQYNVLGHLVGICQNTTQALSIDCVQSPSAGQETRTFAYDFLGRITSETNPENGTKTYIYDTTADLCGEGTYSSNGDLVKTTDAAGNCMLYLYDPLHRLTDIGNSNQALNHCRRFRYDSSAGVSGSTKPAGLTNTLGRMIEASTTSCAGPTDTLLSDEWFSYSPRGELTDVYQSTPHSGGYYHSKASYWANGALNTLSLLNSSGASIIPTQTYSLDGEGRPISVTAASGQNPVTSISYAPAPTTTAPLGALTNVTFGSSDSDGFQYDPNTGRMTQYSFNVNSQSAIGKLTWNTNSTLQKLVVTDPFNSSDNQTCIYAYDDLSRVKSASCGTKWSQTFTYDAFGNITKTGSSSWQPIYNSPANDSITSDNKYKNGWNGVSYDANGNLLNDTFNTYAWDVFGSPISINGSAVTYDAFGRMVENANGVNEFVYSPMGGQPLAVMSGQGAQLVYLPLPGGAYAMYNGAGTLYQYNHPDWLGSARLFSSSSRVATPAMSYAPFGEGYSAGSSTWTQFTGSGNAWTVSVGDNLSGSLEDFMFRRYNPTQGRWISPDPAGVSAAVVTNPQSWNRYAYVNNMPLNNVDPLGLKPNDAVQYLRAMARTAAFFSAFEFFVNVGPDSFKYDYKTIPSTTDTSSDDENNIFIISRDIGGIQLIGKTYGPDVILSMVAYTSSLGQGLLTAGNGKQTPWYKNSCVTGAIAKGALQAGVDSIGLIPEAGGLARLIGNQAGYRGVVADQLGAKVIKSFGGSTGGVSAFAGLGDTSPEGLVSTSLAVAGFIPGLGQIAAGGSIVLDVFKTARAIGKCN